MLLPTSWHILGTAALLALAGCGGPKTAAPPAAGEAVAEFRAVFAERKASMIRQPSIAGQELELVMEGLDSKAEAYGAPFDGWLQETRKIRDQWGDRPKKSDVSEGIEALEQLFAEPAGQL